MTRKTIEQRYYMGHSIALCERAGEHDGKWVVRDYDHRTGSWAGADELCAHYYTLEQAKDAIRGGGMRLRIKPLLAALADMLARKIGFPN